MDDKVLSINLAPLECILQMMASVVQLEMLLGKPFFFELVPDSTEVALGETQVTQDR